MQNEGRISSIAHANKHTWNNHDNYATGLLNKSTSDLVKRLQLQDK